MILEKIRYKNFLSVGGLYVTVELNKTKTTLVVGVNGHGKSTILDAICFALFGKPFRNINKPQLVNSITKKNTEVHLSFSADGRNYLVKRGLKPAIFEVYENGSLLNQDADAREYQEFFERHILKVNHKTFCQVVVLGSASYVPFMSLPAAHRREVIEDLLDLQIFGTMGTLLKTRILNNDGAIEQAGKDKSLIAHKIEVSKDHLRQIQNTNEKIREEKRTRVQETEQKIVILTDELSALDKTIKDLGISDTTKLNKKLAKASDIKSQLNYRLTTINEEIKFLQSHENCPTCNQAIEAGFKHGQIEEKEEKRKEIAESLVLLDTQIAATRNDLAKAEILRRQIDTLGMKRHSLVTEIGSLRRYKNDIENELNSIVEAEPPFSISDLEQEIVGIDKRLEDLYAERKLYNAAQFLLKDTGIKARIIRQYIPVINKLVNKYLSAMDFFVHFELDENFKETIKSRHRDEFTFHSFSEGEKFRINLAILFTWRAIAKMRNSVNCNLLIMDEVLDSSLDMNGTEEFLRIIHSLEDDNNIFVISHKTDQLIDRFHRVLRFTKTKNFSKVAA